jgi:hypothetical protein
VKSKVVKKITGMMAIAGLMVGLTGTAYAASSAHWSVDYSKGAPTTSANPVCYAEVAYTADGFYSYCSSITGSNDRKVTVTEINLGGLVGGSKSITTTGKSAIWKTNQSSSNTKAKFKFVASGSASCSASGSISQN